jgi:diguanylate cyclase (GGDEF)-like protein
LHPTGEEFAVVMPDSGIDAAIQLAQRLCSAVVELAEPRPLSKRQVVTIISIGVAAITPTADDQIGRLVDLADGALYRAKGRGRNRVEAARPRVTSRLQTSR